MFNEQIKNNFPIPVNFFEKAIKNSKLAHAYLLEGNDIWAQYYFALQVAKVLNCQSNLFSQDCTCTNCSWINSNKHPEVLTITPIDYVQDKSTTVISVNQSKKLKEELSNSSRYYRVVIFSDAADGNEHIRQFEENYEKYKDLISIPNNEDEDRVWVPKPLTSKVFQSETANALLKTIEEPNDDIIFFFLTKNKEDMINTIVSRCQVIPLISGQLSSVDFSMLNEITENFPFKDIRSAMHFSEKFMQLTKDMGYLPEELLNSFQEFVKQTLKNNLDNKYNSFKLIEFIKEIENTKMAIKSYVSAQPAIENLFIKSLSI